MNTHLLIVSTRHGWLNTLKMGSTVLSQNIDIYMSSLANGSFVTTSAWRKIEPTGHLGKLALTKPRQTYK